VNQFNLFWISVDVGCNRFWFTSNYD